MRNLKKITAVAVVAAMLLSLVSMSAFAAVPTQGVIATWGSTAVSVVQGGTVDVPIYIRDIDGVVSDVDVATTGLEATFPNSPDVTVTNVTVVSANTYAKASVLNAEKVKFGTLTEDLWIVKKDVPVATLRFAIAASVAKGTTYTIPFVKLSANQPNGTYSKTEVGAPLVITVIEETTIKAVTDTNVNAAYGTAAASLSLPNTVTGSGTTSSQGTASGISLNVTWNTSNYNPMGSSTQVIEGTVTGGSGIIIGSGVTAKANITMTKAPATTVTTNKDYIEVGQGETPTESEIRALLTTGITATAKATNVPDETATITWGTIPTINTAEVAQDVAQITGTVADSTHISVAGKNTVSVKVNVIVPFNSNNTKEVYNKLKALPAISAVTFANVDAAITAQKEAADAFEALSDAEEAELNIAKYQALVDLVTKPDYKNALAAIEAVEAVYNVAGALDGVTKGDWAKVDLVMGAKGVLDSYVGSPEETKFNAISPAPAAKAEYDDAVAKINEYASALVVPADNNKAAIQDAITKAVSSDIKTIVENDAFKGNTGAAIQKVVDTLEGLKAVVDAAVANSTLTPAEGDTLKAQIQDEINGAAAYQVDVEANITDVRVGRAYAISLTRTPKPGEELGAATVTVDVTGSNGYNKSLTGAFAAGANKLRIIADKYLDASLEGEVLTFVVKYNGATVAIDPSAYTVGPKASSGGDSGPISTQYSITYKSGENGTVSGPSRASVNADVKLTVKANEGYELDEITVTTSAGDDIVVNGTSFKMPNAAVTVEATFIEEGTKPTPAPEKDVFEDVPSTYWAYQEIMNLYNAGIINGKTATTFDPDGDITRAEFTKMVAKLFALPTSTMASPFVDCGATDWYTPYVLSAVEAGIVKGEAADWFNANANITREDICTILGRALNVPVPDVELPFSDAAKISDYAVDHVKVLADPDLKIVNGYPDGTFAPQNNATRAEAAKMIEGVVKYLASKETSQTAPVETGAPEATEAPVATEAPAAE